MPSRLFDQLDVIGIVEGYTNGPGGIGNIFSLNNIQFANFGLTGQGSYSGTPFQTQAVATYQKSGIVDFQIFPHVPIDSRITRVTLRFDRQVLADCTATGDPAATCSANINNVSILYVEGALSTAIGPLSDTQFSIAHVAANNAGSGSVVHNYNPPLTYDELVTLWGIVTFIVTISVTAQSFTPPPQAGSVDGFGAITGWSIEVTWQEKYTLEYPDDPIASGDEITITALPDTGLDDVDDVEIHYDDNLGNPHVIHITIFIFHTDTRLTFLLPDISTDQPVVIYFFVGSVLLGSLLTIYFTNGTGIYKLVPGQAFDRLYNQDDPPTTVDVKIPNPRAKTGFIGG